MEHETRIIGSRFQSPSSCRSFARSRHRPAPASPPLSFSLRHAFCLVRGASRHEFRGFHETRNTRHETRLFSDTNHGLCPRRAVGHLQEAATAPRRPHRLQGFPRVTRHKTRLLPGKRRKPARIPRFSRITKHETRNTNHGFFQPRLCRIVASWY